MIAQCNDNVYGPAAGIWTKDYKTVWRWGAALQIGTVWVNTYKVFSVSTPFGGVKMSGTGPEKGRLGILGYTSHKSYYWRLRLESETAERVDWATLNLTINSTLMPNFPFNIERDFAPITMLTKAPNVLVANLALKVKNIRELIALAKAKPGTLAYASPGVGSGLHLAGKLFKQQADIDFCTYLTRAPARRLMMCWAAKCL